MRLPHVARHLGKGDVRGEMVDIWHVLQGKSAGDKGARKVFLLKVSIGNGAIDKAAI